MPGELPLGALTVRQITRAKKVFRRREWLDRAGYSRNDSTLELRVCNQHGWETKTWYDKVLLTNGESKNISITFKAPLPLGTKGFNQPAQSVSKGTVTDRAMIRILGKLSHQHTPLQQRLEMEDVEQGVQSL
jgi:hypothetical protein